MRTKSNGLSTWIEISREALLYNLDCLESKKDPVVKLGLVVKANAYGHGLEEVVRVASGHRAVSYFFTASFEEALLVKSLGVHQPICALVPADSCFLEQALVQQIEFVCCDIEHLNFIAECAGKLRVRARLHLKLDTGLSRLGVCKGGLERIVQALQQHQTTCELVGVMSHLADVVSEDISFALEQRATFDFCCDYLRAFGLMWRETHMGASGTLSFAGNDTLIRVGTALYGYWKSPSEKKRTQDYCGAFEWEPVLTWKSCILHLSCIEEGACVGYGQTFVAPCAMRLAVIPIGYSDGYARELSNCGQVWIAGKLAPVVGRVSMNLLTVDVSAIPNLSRGDEAVLMGPQMGVRADELAERLKTVHIDILSRVRLSIPRIIV